MNFFISKIFWGGLRKVRIFKTLSASSGVQCIWEAKKDRALLTTMAKPEK